MVETQDEENEGEQVLEENEAFYDELDVEYQEAVAMMTLAKQRRAEVNRARQFSRKHQSFEDSKARQAQAGTSMCEMWATGPLER